MAGAARIGALHVMLGLDSAQFTAGLARANTGLDRFARGAKIGMAAVAAAALAAGAALAVAVKGAIDNADELSKTAQKVGVTTEALSRLNWAAKLSDVGLEQLSGGLQRLSRNMLDVSQGGGATAATAFRALGIAVTDADGKLRASDQVFADIADRFSRMPDGVEKTALAMQLFGRAGAEMIPLLNSGKDGLSAMAAEADRLGITLSTTTGRAAEAFNDSLTRVQAAMDGVANKVMAAVLPSLDTLVAALGDPQFAANAQQIAVAVVDAMKVVIDAVNAAVGAFNTLREATTWASTHDMFGNAIDQGNGAPEKLLPSFSNKGQALEGLKSGSGPWNQSAVGADFYSRLGITAAPAIKATEDVDNALADLSSTMRDVATTSTSAGGGVRAMTDEVAASTSVIGDLEDAGSSLASSLASGLANVFSSVVDGSKTAVEAVGDLLKSLGDMLIHQGFQALIGGLFGGMGGGGGGIGSFLGGLFGGGGGGGLKLGFNGIPGFADGTNFAPGGMAWVGEKGPELVNLPRGSQVIPNDELGMGGPTISISITGSRQDAAEIAREIRKVLPDVIQSYNRNPLRRYP